MISPTNTVSPEWQNENELRSFPLEDDAPSASVIPTWLIADMRITADIRYTHLFISNVYISETLISVSISGVIGDGAPVGLLTKAITRDELQPHRAYSFDRFTETAAGTISFGTPPDGYDPVKISPKSGDSRILASVITRTRTPGVTRIIDAVHGNEASGIIDLSGNSEFRTYLDPEDPSGKTIVISLDDLYRDLTTSLCVREPSFSVCGETPVRTINGVSPTVDGVITLKFR